MAAPIQQASRLASSGTVTSGGALLATGATALNLIVTAIAVDKDSGAITVPAGFTLVHDYVSANVSGALAYKVAAGGETAATFSWVTARPYAAWIAEYAITNARLVSAAEADSGAGNVATQTAGPTQASDANGISVAATMVDTGTAYGAGNVAWTDPFAHQQTVGLGTPPVAGTPGLSTADRDVVAGSAVSATASWPTGDQAYTAVAVFAPQAAPAPTPQTPTIVHRRVGGATKTSANVSAKLKNAASARLVVSRSADLSAPVYSGAVAPNAAGMVKASVSGLTPGTQHYFGWELDGALNADGRGKFRTLRESGSFSFGVGCCAVTGSNHAVFDSIRLRSPDFFAVAGDANYADITANDPQAFRNAYDGMYAQPRQAAFYSEVATDDVWDDHNFGGDSSDKGSAAKPAAQNVYREYLPHRELPATDGGIYQSFGAGRVRFVLLDSRSYRSFVGDPDTAAKTMLGAAQKQWLKDTLVNSPEPVKVIISPVSWTSSDATGDNFGRYATERKEIADFVQAAGLSGLVYFICGDMHGLAADDGSGSTGYGSFPVAQIGALDQVGAQKGGPYSQGVSLGGGRYGWFDVVDAGGSTMAINFSGTDSAGNVLISMATTFALPQPAAPPPPSAPSPAGRSPRRISRGASNGQGSANGRGVSNP